MKILWLTNKIIPAVFLAMEQNTSFVNEGWITYMFSQLCEEDDIEMTVVCCGGIKNASGISDKFAWFVVEENRFSETTYDEKQKEVFEHILTQVKPDVIHVWGSEYPHTLAMALAAKKCGCVEKMIISLQGIISFYSSYYYYCGLPKSVVHSRTFYDILRRTNIEDQERVFAERGKYEIAALKEVHHVIGRTEWDKRCVLAQNPDLNYHFCNETLRKEFYSGIWNYEECKKFSIFVSQATYTLKGFHLLIEALPKVIEKFPDTQVYVAGEDIRGLGSIKKRLKCNSYGRYLRRSIEDKGLNSCIHFLGKLNAEKMKEQYLNSNVFVCCSSIENSPNSVGEAMILGVPVICSDVGGVRSVFSAPEEGWTYRWDDTNQLSQEIIEAFSDYKEATERGSKAREHAFKTHDARKNYKTLCDIYKVIKEE